MKPTRSKMEKQERHKATVRVERKKRNEKRMRQDGNNRKVERGVQDNKRPQRMKERLQLKMTEGKSGANVVTDLERGREWKQRRMGFV